MLRHSRTFLVWSLFALVIAALALIGTFAPSYQKCTASNERGHTDNKQPNLYEPVASSAHLPLFFLCEGAFIDENSGTLTAIATIAIAAFTLTLWRATTEHGRITDKVLALARDEFIATHRPKLIVRQFVLTLPIRPDQPLRAEFNIINIGASPGTWRATSGEIALWNGRFWEPPGVDPATRSVVPREIRNGAVVTGIILSRFHITSNQISRINDGSLMVCAVGEIVYTDRLATERRTGFHRCYDVGADRFNASDHRDQEYQD